MKKLGRQEQKIPDKIKTHKMVETNLKEHDKGKLNKHDDQQ